MPSRFLNNVNINDSYTLPAADGTADQIITTDGAGQLSFIDQGDVIAGEADKAKSVILRVKNATASPMTKGQVICEAVSASPPSGNLIEVALADNDGTNTMPALGILNEDLDAVGGANDEGDAIMFGKVSGINTSAFSVGDEVYVDSTPGGLTLTKPTGVKYIQKVGVVIRDDATNGTIEVFGAGRVNDVPTPLYIDHANQRLGIGETNPDTLLHLTGNQTTIKIEDNVGVDYYNPKIIFAGSANEQGTLEHISNPSFQGMRLHYRNAGVGQDTYLELKGGQAAFNSSNITGGTNVSMTGELQVFGGDTSYFSNGKVAIGTTTASEKLSVVGNALVSNNVYIGLGNTLKSCTYPAAHSLAVGKNNILGGISNGIIGVSNSIDCTAEPWLNFGGNFIAGINNVILGPYSHANAIFGQLNDLGTSSINNSNTLISGSEHEVTTSNSLLFGKQCRSLGNAVYSLTGGFDSNNFSAFGSVAIGAGATASNGYNQYAFGTGVTTNTHSTIAYGADQFVVGKYNEYTNASFLPHRFAVGNGLNDASRDTPFCVIGGGTYTNGQVSINDADGFAYSSAPYSVFHVNGRPTSSYSSVFTVTSDERLKKDILDYNKGLAEILQVQPKSYSFNGKAKTIEGVESIGVLAQEIKEVFPETVGTVNKKLNPEDGQETELYTVDISPVTYALINAVKELNAKVEALEARIQTLEGN